MSAYLLKNTLSSSGDLRTPTSVLIQVLQHSFLPFRCYLCDITCCLLTNSPLWSRTANDFWSSLAPSFSSFASSSSPQHSWVKMLVYRVSVPPTSPTSNKPHITTNVLQNLISIVTKSVKTKGDILACIIFKLSFAVWYDRVTCYVNICAMLSCLKIVFIQFISLIGRDFDFQRWNICCRYSKRKIKSRDGETFSINWKSKDNHPTTCPSVFFISSHTIS